MDVKKKVREVGGSMSSRLVFTSIEDLPRAPMCSEETSLSAREGQGRRCRREKDGRCHGMTYPPFENKSRKVADTQREDCVKGRVDGGEATNEVASQHPTAMVD